MEEKKLPLVCICVPTYNSENTVNQTLQTILSQSYKNLVVHVSDNASTDKTPELVQSILDNRVTLHLHDENIEGEGNFTRCIKYGEGKYTAIFHSDDLYESEIVAKQVAFLETHPEVCAVFTAAMKIDEQGRSLGKIGSPLFCKKGGVAIYGFIDLLKIMLQRHNFLVCPSVMVRTHVYQTVVKKWGNPLFNWASDVDTWLRLSKSAPIAVINEPLMRYRVSTTNTTSIVARRTERADFFSVMDYYLELPEVTKHLTKKDFRRYQWLQRHEDVVCAMNLLSIGEIDRARKLLDEIYSIDSFYAAITTGRGFLTLATGSSLRLSIKLGLAKNFSRLAKKIKNTLRK